jgi:octaprenyl-diphosphate synthase
MSEGELLQIEKARKLDIDEAVYFDIISRKTAALIASCCSVGAASADAGTDMIEHMKETGKVIGIAFQVKDDLFDYELSNKTGKPTGIDIKESKMTLPLIYSLSVSDASEKRHIINIIKNHNTDDKKVKEVLDFVDSKKGIAYAKEKMFVLRDEAIARIQTYPDNEYRRSLTALVNFTIEREH